MPNVYFQFKQFRIEQDKCSMKVCTDSCVFGAWIASGIESKSPQKILDIGTGTGLLSLMLAQKTSAIIHAIDIDDDAKVQAWENFNASPWNNRLQVFCGHIKKWHAASRYDYIISNPPFFENDLVPQDAGKKNSKHSNSLHLNELIVAVEGLLAKDGCFAVLLPHSRQEYFEKEAASHSLFVVEKLHIRQSIKHNYFRTILILEKTQHPVKQSELSIRNNSNEYTSEFISLMKDYYLYL